MPWKLLQEFQSDSYRRLGWLVSSVNGTSYILLYVINIGFKSSAHTSPVMQKIAQTHLQRRQRHSILHEPFKTLHIHSFVDSLAEGMTETAIAAHIPPHISTPTHSGDCKCTPRPRTNGTNSLRHRFYFPWLHSPSMTETLTTISRHSLDQAGRPPDINHSSVITHAPSLVL